MDVIKKDLNRAKQDSNHEVILETILRPFLLAQKNDYAALNKIKFLETFVKNLIEKNAPLFTSWQQRGLEDLKQLIRDFDRAKYEEKKKKVAETITLIKRLINPPPQWEILLTSLENVPMLTPKWQKAFRKKEIFSLEDLLYFLPIHYEDYRHFKLIKEAQPNQSVVVGGEIVASGLLAVKKGRRKLYKVVISDSSGKLVGVWFNYQLKYMQTEFKPARQVIFSGIVHLYGMEKVIYHPEVVWEKKIKPQIVPIYSEISGVYPRQLRNLMQKIIAKYAHFLGCPLPVSLRQRYNLSPLWEAVFYLHFPQLKASIVALNQGITRYHKTLKFIDFFFLELGLALKRRAYLNRQAIAFNPSNLYTEPFLKTLPFTLTQAQKRVIEEIKQDMTSARPMHRLLQGDVGSGKTIVALMAALMAIESGYQAAIMAPTEILAEQHFINAKNWLKDLPLEICLVTSQLKPREKQTIYKDILRGKYYLIIGTHALIQEEVKFYRLGLVIIDEQHRFGVAQRATLIAKGITPDVLVVTATPIPRTLSMTFYGDLDISLLDEMPPGRKPIKTIHFKEGEREQVYHFLKEKITQGAQIYIVYPLIEDSEAMDLRAATSMYETLKERFPQYRLALLHGRMKIEEKQKIMASFRSKKIDILISTTIIEVGVDVPQASVMVIEHAERFGLAQLHQLRGRVGRGMEQAYCLLLTPQIITSLARERLKNLVETNDGFKIAEADLVLRGPGEILGTKQAGFLKLRFADMVKDIEILKEAREAAFHLIATDPQLKVSAHKYILPYLKHYWGEQLKFGMVG
jgi:ATP-dependent DNA helicase RecG